MITRNMMAGTAGGSVAQVFEFKYTVATNATGSSDKKSALPINLYGQTGVEISVDWGDGSTSILKPSDYTASSSLASVHEYSTTGTYHITASSSNWNDAYFLSCYADATISSANNANQPVYWWRRTLKSVDSPLPPVKGVMRLASASATSMTASNNDLGFFFHRCEKMTSIPANLFENAGHIEEFNSTFYNCIVLPSIPAGLFDPCISALNFSDCFRYCLALTSIPVSFFKYCTAATNMYNVFRFCNKVPSVPADLFRYNTHVTNMGGAFSKCDALKNFQLCIGSPNVATVTDFIPNASNVTRIVCVPADSTTYTSFNAYKNTSNNVTVSTNNADCGIEEEEVDDGTWQFTVNTQATASGEKKAGIPFNLYEQTGIELTIDWGDGSTSTLTPSDYAADDSEASVHTYSSAGEYTVTVSSTDWENTYLLSTTYPVMSSSSKDYPVYCWQRTLTSVNTKMPKVKGIQLYTSMGSNTLNTYSNSLKRLFADCEKLTSIPSGLFDRNTAITDFTSCFYDANLASIPSKLFDNNTAATSFYYCFAYCPITSIPSGLFDKNTAVTTFFGCFFDCTSLTSIPAGLFDNNTAATTFTQCFTYSHITSIPAGLFDNNTAATSFFGCFDNCSYLASIPAGLFDNNTAVTTFSNCFDGCSSLASIPAGLFDNNTSATTFSNCFSGCSQIQSIPSGLFDKNTLATKFDYCFDGCSSLASIPSGLFSKNTAVTNMRNCFNSCSSLTNFHLKISSSSVSNFTKFISNASNVDRIICVPAGSTTYTTISNFVANNSSGVVVSTDIIDCSEVWEFTIDTEATTAGEKKTGIPFNLYGQTGIELTVDWGDNTTSTLTPSDYTSSDSTASVHEYATVGEYTVTVVSNDWENTYLLFYNSSISSDSNTKYSSLYWFRRTATSIDTKLPQIKGVKDADTLTVYNNSLQSLFYNLGKITSIPSGLLDNNTAASDFQYCFRNCSSLQSIPSGLFDKNTSATSFGSCFSGCTSIQSIPSGLFDKNTAVTSFSYCFYYCTSLTSIPSGLLDNNTAVTSFQYGFCGCNSLQSIPAGLFDKNTAVTNFGYCFFNCTSLTSIPSGLFDKNTAVTSFYQCFQNCTSLTSIPSGLFDKNTVVNTFSYCFRECTSLQSIPAGLFDKNTAVTNFTSCFYGCTSIQSIPVGLFDKNTAVTNFYGCFQNCTSLTSIPSGLFYKNTAVTSFNYCFYNCTNLLNFHLKIGSSSVTVFGNFISNASNVYRNLCVPANSTTYTSASSYANSSNSITVSTDITDCADTWEFTIDTEAAASGERKTSIPFNLYGQTGVEMTVDWGDDTATTLTPSNYASDDSTASVHEYATAGTYTVTIACNDWNNTYLYNHEAQVISSLSNANAAAYWFRRTLIYINEQLPLIKGTKRTTYNSPNSATAHNNDLGYCFIGCTALTSIRSGLFNKNVNATSFSHCFDKCTSISSIPSGLFDKNTAATNFEYCFSDCTSLITIPAGLFDKNTAATTFLSCFSYDSSLYSIPAGLFDKNTKVTTFKWCFHNCTSLRAIPAGLFDKNTKATSFSNCFAYCSSLASIPAGLFDKNTKVTTFYMCFYGCAVTTISNGLFKNNTAVTTFYNCFGNCTSLLNFHLIIGSSSVSSFDGFIPNASNVDRLLCVPADSTTYTSATAMANASNGVVVSTDFMECAETWEFTIDTEATASGEKKTGIPFNLYGQDGIKLLVDWGDNTTSTLLPSDYANNNCTASIHEYAVAGEYTVTIACNDWENAYLLVWKYGEITSEANKHAALYRFRRTVTSIDTKLPKVKGVKSYQSLYATTLTTYDNSLESLFGRANKLASIPAGLFDNNTVVTTFAGCFSSCSSLQSIPYRLFANNTAATTFEWCFYGCESLTSIPSGLFYYNTAATNFSDCFNDCYSLASIPEELFYRNTAATTFKRCMKNCAMTSIPADMFGNKPSATDFELCFTGCENLVSLPDGLFDGCTAATTFSDCFFGCYALSSIPSRLFYKTTAITNLNNCFYSCENLLNFHLIIGSPYVDVFDGFIDNIDTENIDIETIERILCVPDNSLTYTRATNNLASNDNKIIVSTDITDCLETWEITIDTEASEEGAKTTGIPFNLAAGYQPTYNITLYVDWGDGTASVLTSNDYLSQGNYTTRIVSNASVHEYAVPGQYQITIAATDWKHVELIEYPNTFLDITAPDDFNIALYWFKKTLITIDKALPTVYRYGICKLIGYSSTSTIYGFEGLFAECHHLQAIPSDLFVNNTSVTDFSYCFKDCRAVQSIPENLFALHTEVTTFMCTFSGCTSLTTIPTNLFANNVSVKTFQLCFYNDASILNFEINIGSSIVSNCYSFIPKNANATQRIVNVPRPSTTYTTFNNKAADLGITVVGV